MNTEGVDTREPIRVFRWVDAGDPVEPADFQEIRRYTYPGTLEIASLDIVAIADFDADGFDDVLGETAANGLYIAWGGDGGAADLELLQLDDGFGDADDDLQQPFVSDATSADFNGDGFLDLAVVGQLRAGPAGSAEVGRVVVYAGSADRNSWRIDVDEAAPTTTFSLYADASDLNGDGVADLVFFDDQEGPGNIWTGTRGTTIELQERVLLQTDGDSRVPEVADVFDDGLRDVVGGSLSAWLGESTGAFERSSYTLTPWPGSASELRVFSLGEGLSAIGLDAFGDPYAGPRVSVRPGPREADPSEALVRRALAIPNGAVAIAGPLTVTGRTRLVRAPDTPRSSVVRVENRAGPGEEGTLARLPMNVTGPFAEQTGYVVAIPLREAFWSAPPAASQVRVFRRVTDWVRASDTPGSEVSGDDVLPRIDGASRYLPTKRWGELSSDALSGSGPRYALDFGASPPMVYVVTDELGDFLVLALP